MALVFIVRPFKDERLLYKGVYKRVSLNFFSKKVMRILERILFKL